MKTCRFILAVAGSILLFASCTITQSVPIEVLHSGKVMLPAHTRNLAFIARNFKYNIDTLGNYYSANYQLKKVPKKQNKGIDSLAVRSSLSGLRKKLLATGRYDTIVTYPYNTMQSHRSGHILPLSPGFISQICRESRVDGVVSLEMISYFYSHVAPGIRDDSGESSVKINALWALYLPGKENPVDHFRYSDDLVWNRYDQYGDLVSSKSLPDRKTAIEMAAQIAGEKYASHMGPDWKTVNRMLITPPGDDWKKAEIMAKKNQWEEAAAMWNRLESLNKGKNKGLAEYNLAVAAEMLNQVDLAVSWISKAARHLDGTRFGPMAGQYLAILLSRKKQIANLTK